MRSLLPVSCFIASTAQYMAQRQRYGAVPGLIRDGLTPRYLADSFDAEPIIKRVGTCGSGKHPCLDIRRGDRCCADSTYCFVNNDGEPKCCPIGNDCRDSNPCNSESFFCAQVSTASGTTITQEGCCGKQCPSTSLYLCPSSLGGNCCGYGSECQEGGGCVKTVEATTSEEPGLTPVPEGCTTSQYRCDDGEGCCNMDQKCTKVGDTAYCASGTPTGSSIEIITGGDRGDDNGNAGGKTGAGLSPGAQAGIGVGATVGGGLLAGLLVWFCISRRRKHRSTGSHQTGEHSLPAIIPGAGASAAAGYHEDNMTEYTESSRHWQSQSRGVGPTQDYFGPSAVPGPFTDDHLFPENQHSPPPAAGRAVPSQPHNPGDIAAPVEIDSTVRSPGSDEGGLLSPTSFSDFQTSSAPESPQARGELYGSGGDPQLSSRAPPKDERL